MPAYISLGKFTQQGVTTIKEGPERSKRARARAESMGGKFIGTWRTLGEYDIVMIVEFPDDQTAAAYMLTVAGAGTVTTQTMRAFSEEEFVQVVGKMP